MITGSEESDTCSPSSLGDILGYLVFGDVPYRQYPSTYSTVVAVCEDKHRNMVLPNVYI